MDTSVSGGNRSTFLASRVLIVLLGIIALLWSGIVLGLFIYFFAIFAIIGSIGTIAVAISYSKEQLPAPRWAVLLLGIIGIIIGIWAAVAPAYVTVAIIYFIGAWALVMGVGDLIHAFTRTPAGNPRLWLVLSGIVSVLFGLLVLFYPPLLTALFLVQVLGIYAILFGLLGIGYGLSAKSGAAMPGAAA